MTSTLVLVILAVWIVLVPVVVVALTLLAPLVGRARGLRPEQAANVVPLAARRADPQPAARRGLSHLAG